MTYLDELDGKESLVIVLAFEAADRSNAVVRD